MAAYDSKEVFRVLVAFSLCFAIVHGATDTKLTRKVSSEFICNDTRVVTSSAVGKSDALHYVYSTFGVPTVLVARTNTTGQIKIDCDKFFNESEMAQSITFTEQHYAYAVMFNKLYEYDDTEDVADLEKLPTNTSWHVHELDQIEWLDFQKSDVENNTIKFTLNKDSNDLHFYDNGSLSIEVRLKGMYHRDELLPHLEYNANMTMVDLVLNNINTSFSNARFAIEMTMVSLDGVPNKMNIMTATYIDDEHSPGVFQMIDWTSRGSNQTWSGFFQFKPVCYTSSERSLGDATKAVFYDIHTPNNTMEHKASVAYAYFGNGMFQNNFSMTMTNVSFGLSKDKFYTKTNYTVWTASIGFGTPPADEVSIVIIIVLSVGLGLPIVLILFGSIGICIKKKKGSNAYAEISPSDSQIN